jgi:YD repeat-containing protein
VYTYLNGFRLLTGATYSQGGKQWSRQYLYEDAAYPAALTGITDERGVRYATWHYDAQGRAISSEHANGAEKVTLTYNDDGSTTVTNALGHAVTYRYQVIQGIKHITSIEGEPAAGCPASNSSYTYNTIGQVATRTDALGHITAYTYDTLGRETQRVEAQGTPQARTTTTTWHGTSFLPETVTTADRVTTYTYDTQNRLLSTSTHAAQGSVP